MYFFYHFCRYPLFSLSQSTVLGDDVEAVCGTVEAEAARRLEASYPVGFQLQSRPVVQLAVDRCDKPVALGVMISLVTMSVYLPGTLL